MSALATQPTRPTFGVNNQTAPPSTRSWSVSTRASTRSPSSSRHHRITPSTTSPDSPSTSSLPVCFSISARSASSTSSSHPNSWMTVSGTKPNCAALTGASLILVEFTENLLEGSRSVCVTGITVAPRPWQDGRRPQDKGETCQTQALNDQPLSTKVYPPNFPISTPMRPTNGSGPLTR